MLYSLRTAKPAQALPLLLLLLVLAPWLRSTASAAPPAAVFAPHPRLAYSMPDAFTPEFTQLTAAEKQHKWAKLIAAAEAIVAEAAEIPSAPGQWIYYYACPQHNCSLHYRQGQHICPRCGKVYNDARVEQAYVTKQYYRIDRNCLTVAMAYRVTGRDQFAAEVYRVLSHYARVYPGMRRHDRWGRKGWFATIGGKRFCQSLDEATNIITLSQAYDLVYDWSGISADQRRRIEQDFFMETYKCLTYITMPHSRDNHTTWFNAGIAAIGAVLGRAELLQQAVHGKRGLRWQLQNSVTQEGLWYEGSIAYHFYALQAVIATVRTAAACGLDLTAEPMLKKLFLAPLRLAYPNGQLPAFNDGDRGQLSGYRRLYKFAAATWPDPELHAFAATGQVPELRSEVLAEAGLAYLRRGTGAQAVTAILDFGEHGGDHGHPDKLNLLLYCQGGELFLDPGRLTYRCAEHQSWTRQTAAHNTVAINQQSQAPQPGRLLYFERGQACDLVVAEAADNYPGVRMRRALVLADTLLIDCFFVQADQAATCDWFLHGTAALTLPGAEAWTDLPTPLHTDAGYQHLTDLRQTTPQTMLRLDWQRQQNIVTTHLWLAAPSRAYAGNGIGYSLQQKVPFVMLRQHGKEALYVAVHDLQGRGDQISIQPPADAQTGPLSFTVTTAEAVWQIRWQMRTDGKLVAAVVGNR